MQLSVMNFLNYIKILRPINLLIVAISQWLIYVVYLFPMTEDKMNVELDDRLWLLFIIDTVLIAAAGYVINDLMDQKADAFNKPNKVYIGIGKIPPVGGWIYYGVLVLVGFGLAFYIANAIGKMHLLVIYPVAVCLLFLYSYSFKKLPLIGNLVVSIFCAFVPGIIWYAEFDVINSFEFQHNIIRQLVDQYFPAYITFAFLSTFVREIIKDIEDVQGDMKSSYRTLPVVAGISRSNVIALFFSILLFLSYGLWIFNQQTHIKTPLILPPLLLGLVIPTGYIIYSIYRAKSTADYSNISKMLKYLMIVSLFIFLCIPYIFYFASTL